MLKIIDYDPQFKKYFTDLNIEWIAEYFEVEPLDREQLEDPEQFILSKGGKIYFAELDGEIIGTVALIKDSDTEYELAKMAVAPLHRGSGAGKKLGEHAIEEAQRLGCKYLYLESNQKLKPALSLYAKLGFVQEPVTKSPYARSNFRASIHFT